MGRMGKRRKGHLGLEEEGDLLRQRGPEAHTLRRMGTQDDTRPIGQAKTRHIGRKDKI